MLYASVAETAGVSHEFLTPAEIRRSLAAGPHRRPEGCAVPPDQDGYINPADVTQAMAKGARQHGVRRSSARCAGRWLPLDRVGMDRHACTMMVEKGGNLVPSEEKFEITAEHVVTATGNHAQRTARLLGFRIPAIPVEHQYIVTEPDPALQAWRKAGNPEHPVLRDADAKWYVREERGGWILGPYEKGAPARFDYAVPESFRADLFPLDLERIEDEYMSMIHRHAVLGKRRAEGRFQRPDLLHARRQPAGRPGPGPAQHVAGRGLLASASPRPAGPAITSRR